MPWTVGRIAEITSGILHGDPDRVIDAIAPLEEATPRHLSFVQGPEYYGRGRNTRAGALLCEAGFSGFNGPRIVVDDPKIAVAALLEDIARERYARAPGVDSAAVVHKGAVLGGQVTVAPGAVIEECARIGDGAVVHAGATVSRQAVIGPDTVVHAGAHVGEGVRIGSRCVIGPGSCLGQAGFGVSRRPDGTLASIPQVGGVEIGDDVEIGALCTVDRGTLGDTVIGDGTRMDNHCHIAHNTRIGKHCLLVAYARIAGSTVLEDHVTVAEDVGITDNVCIGRGARIGGGSKVYKSVKPGQEVWGAPARELGLEKRIQACLRRLPEYRDKIRELWRAARPDLSGEGDPDRRQDPGEGT